VKKKEKRDFFLSLKRFNSRNIGQNDFRFDGRQYGRSQRVRPKLTMGLAVYDGFVKRKLIGYKDQIYSSRQTESDARFRGDIAQ